MVLSMERWVGKVAVVTGASSGCGAAIAEELTKQGLLVVGLARRLDRLEELSSKCASYSGKFFAKKTDIGVENEIVEAFSWVLKNVGPVAVLVNNAGMSAPTTLIGGDSKMWRQILEVNVLGLSIATREAVDQMTANDIAGQVIHINSVLGHYVPFLPEVNMYPASKFAVTALTETLRQELLKSGTKIRVTSVSPGPVDTEFTRYMKEEFAEKFAEMPKLDAGDVADTVVFVLSTPPHVQVQDIIMRPLGEPV